MSPKKKTTTGAAATPPPESPREPTDLEKIEAEMREISPRLSGLKRSDPQKYREVYKRFMWLVAERDRLKQ